MSVFLSQVHCDNTTANQKVHQLGRWGVSKRRDSAQMLVHNLVFDKLTKTQKIGQRPEET